MGDVTTEQVGGQPGATPDSPGAKPQQEAFADAGAVVQPQEQAPDQTEVQPSEAPVEPEDAFNAEMEKLTPAQRKDFQRALTKMRQKDAEKVRGVESELQNLAWARQLNQLTTSGNPQDLARAADLLELAVQGIRKQAPKPEEAPQVDWDSVEAIAPGLGRIFQAQQARLQQLEASLGQVAGTAEGTAYRAAEREFEREVGDIQDWAKERNLPFNLERVLKVEQENNLADLRKAYFFTYGDELITAGKQAAQASLQRKKEAALPGAGAQGAATGQRPKFKTMLEAWEWAKREHGVSGPLEYKG